MSGTSDIGQMYQQELQRRGVPMNAGNMRMLVEESRRNPGVIQGLSVQGEADPAGDVLGALRNGQSPTPSAATMSVPQQAASPLPTPPVPPGIAAPQSSDSGMPTPPMPPNAQSIAQSVVGAQPNMPPETGEPMQSQPVGAPGIDPAGMAAPQPAPLNDAERIGNLIRNYINSGSGDGTPAFTDPEGPPGTAPGMAAVPNPDGPGIAGTILSGAGVAGTGALAGMERNRVLAERAARAKAAAPPPMAPPVQPVQPPPMQGPPEMTTVRGLQMDSAKPMQTGGERMTDQPPAPEGRVDPAVEAKTRARARAKVRVRL